MAVMAGKIRPPERVRGRRPLWPRARLLATGAPVPMKSLRSTSPTSRAALLAIACALAACATQSALDRSGELSRLGDHHIAMFEAERMRDAALRGGVADPEIERHYASVRARFLLEEGRRMIFVEQEEEALALLSGYLAWRPDDPEALELIEQAKKE